MRKIKPKEVKDFEFKMSKLEDNMGEINYINNHYLSSRIKLKLKRLTNIQEIINLKCDLEKLKRYIAKDKREEYTKYLNAARSLINMNVEIVMFDNADIYIDDESNCYFNQEFLKEAHDIAPDLVIDKVERGDENFDPSIDNRYIAKSNDGFENEYDGYPWDIEYYKLRTDPRIIDLVRKWSIDYKQMTNDNYNRAFVDTTPKFWGIVDEEIIDLEYIFNINYPLYEIKRKE